MNVYPFKAVYPKVELIASPKSFFSNIKYQFSEYRSNGIYKNHDEDVVYVYQIKNKDSKHRGIVCCTDVDELKRKNIKKHEKTLSAKEQHMMHLFLQRKALVKPVLLGYKGKKKINSLIEKVVATKPLIEIELKSASETHTIWAATVANSKALLKEFGQLKTAYIGDGHHRSTTISILNSSKELGKEAKNYSQLLTAYFSFDELIIRDYNRVVDIADVMKLPEFVVSLSQVFDIKKIDGPQKPAKKNLLTMYMSKNWYQLKWKAKILSNQKGQSLDSALLNKHVFGNILGIEDVRLDNRISYYGGSQPLSKISNNADKAQTGIGFCIFPVKVKELTFIADNDATLPPKSTWFEPRLKSGIIARDIR